MSIFLSLNLFSTHTLTWPDEIRKLEKEEENRLNADKSHREIMKWLSPDDFEETHERHFKKRFGNTGKWLLEDLRFVNWRDGIQSSLLWCHGARESHAVTFLSWHIFWLSSSPFSSRDLGRLGESLLTSSLPTYEC